MVSQMASQSARSWAQEKRIAFGSPALPDVTLSMSAAISEVAELFTGTRRWLDLEFSSRIVTPQTFSNLSRRSLASSRSKGRKQ